MDISWGKRNTIHHERNTNHHFDFDRPEYDYDLSDSWLVGLPRQDHDYFDASDHHNFYITGLVIPLQVAEAQIIAVSVDVTAVLYQGSSWHGLEGFLLRIDHRLEDATHVMEVAVHCGKKSDWELFWVTLETTIPRDLEDDFVNP
jgi:hypothetical protein